MTTNTQTHNGDILAVDDNPSNLDLLNNLLTRRGYQVRTVSNGRSALEMIATQPPELILMDINMPDMDGFTVTNHIKASKSTRDIPVIFISALDDMESKMRAFTSGGVDYITKPFQPREVAARVQTHISLQRMRKDLLLGKNILEATLNAVSDLVILADQNGTIVNCNYMVLERTGTLPEKVIGRAADDFFRDVMGLVLPANQDAAELESCHREAYLPKMGGWFEIICRPVHLVDVLQGSVYTLSDITIYKNAEANERAARQFAEALHKAGVSINSSLNIDEVLDNILEQISQVIPHVSSNMLLVEGNNQARMIRLRGYENYADKDQQQIVNLVFDIETTLNLCEMAKTGLPYIIPNTHEFPGWNQNVTSQQIRSWVGAPLIAHSRVIAFIGLDHTSPNFFTQEHADQLAIFAAQASMAIENARLFKEVNEMATVDFLTGLYNRRHFFTLAEREVERAHRSGNALSLIILDLDYLKQINSKHGHIVGGQSLQAVGRLCREFLSPNYIMAVYGGDEFAIMLPDTCLDDACEVAERFRQYVSAQPINTYRGPVNITITLGVAGVQGSSDFTLEKMIDCADQALFKAKDEGRNRVLAWR